MWSDFDQFRPNFLQYLKMSTAVVYYTVTTIVITVLVFIGKKINSICVQVTSK